MCDLKFQTEGCDPHLEVVVSKAKNFSFYDPRTSFISANPGSVYCAVQIVQDYLEVYNPRSPQELLFPASAQHGDLAQNPIQYNTMLSAFRGVMSLINVPDFKLYTLHSPRTGGLSEAANSGLCSEAELTRHGRWQAGSSVPATYRKQDITSQLRASRSLYINSL